MRELFRYEQRDDLSSRLFSRREVASKQALLACSEVSVAMRQAALPFLFHTIAFSITPHYDLGFSHCTCHSFDDLEVDEDEDEVYWEDFRGIYSRNRQFVRELRVRMRCTTGQCAYYGFGSPELSGAVLLNFAASLPRLRVLILENIELSWGVQPPRLAQTPMLALESFSCRAKHHLGSEYLEAAVSDIAYTLTALVSADTVHFNYHCFYNRRALPDGWQAEIMKLERSVKISSLRFTECLNVGCLLDFLRATSALQPDTLKTLKCSSLSEGCMIPVSNFLVAYGAKLGELSLEIPGLDHFSQQCACGHRLINEWLH